MERVLCMGTPRDSGQGFLLWIRSNAGSCLGRNVRPPERPVGLHRGHLVLMHINIEVDTLKQRDAVLDVYREISTIRVFQVAPYTGRKVVEMTPFANMSLHERGVWEEYGRSYSNRVAAVAMQLFGKGLG